MKVDVPVKEIVVSQTRFAEAFEQNRTRAHQLMKDGVVVRATGYNNGEVLLFESLKTYFQVQSYKPTSIPIKEMTVTQVQFAAAIGKSQARVSQLIDEGIVIRDEMSRSGRVMLFASLQNYFQHKSGKSGSGISVSDEKALLVKAKRELAELKLAKAKGEVVNAAEMEKALMKIFIVLRTKLLALPSSLALQLENQDRNEVHGVLSSVINEILLDLSELDFSAIKAGSGDK